MNNYTFPDFKIETWKETRSTLQSFSQLLTDIKKNVLPASKELG
jgi:hypothetical protein